MSWLTGLVGTGDGVYGTRHRYTGSVSRLERLEIHCNTHCREAHQIRRSRQLPLQLRILKLLAMQHRAW